ncbi:MAG: MBOAT family protein [Lachnospiraceae bacterium]|nr:MBOAT family protein [Lachnospiraceae bacterium]
MQFLIFFPTVVLIYFIIPAKYRYLWLLACSYFYYLCRDDSVVLFLIIATVITWATGGILDKITDLKLKRAVAISGAIINLLPLIVLKYGHFALGLVNAGISFDPLLPAGISFYIFQSTTYIIDRYRGETEVEKNFLKYALFVSFFPCILSGPIERSKNFLIQIDEKQAREKRKGFDPVRCRQGLMYMLWGYFLKLVIVSRLTILTDNVFSLYKGFKGYLILVAVFAYSFQIYCDFAGYSFIAVGCAKIMGYDITLNFRQPYLAKSVADFWRRWHISLSSWFRDYLYIPLGGNRKGNLRRYLNIMIVFLLSGLWHGANLTFVFWGFLFGAYQVVGYIIRKKKKTGPLPGEKGAENGAFGIVLTFVLVTLTWIPFRAQSISEAFDVFVSIFSNYGNTAYGGSLSGLGLGVNNLLFVIFAVIVLIFTDVMCEKRKCTVATLFENSPVVYRWGFYYLLIVMILFSLNLSTTEFLYQKF